MNFPVKMNRMRKLRVKYVQKKVQNFRFARYTPCKFLQGKEHIEHTAAKSRLDVTGERKNKR